MQACGVLRAGVQLQVTRQVVAGAAAVPEVQIRHAAIAQRFGLVVDQVRGREEVVIKPLPKALRGLRGYAGATLIGDGRMALILDVDGLR